jgi:hypothetical protein
MRTALVVITTKQRTERIRSMAPSIVALGTDRICDIIRTPRDGALAWSLAKSLTTLSTSAPVPSPRVFPAGARAIGDFDEAAGVCGGRGGLYK